ncbi:hypothetical protein CERSUDRAFT_99158 [Gelatoporia subvermispora B]|uniref:beta-glucosidase n=1 Tax=Ceriporiopsis subvermispora (strain B) TaxID=914234 RepID=M2R1M0_CERS8|nr:hypothetical protein CERSUDRAFT_99158 [Gelatoporia subvermispora B]
MLQLEAAIAGSARRARLAAKHARRDRARGPCPRDPSDEGQTPSRASSSGTECGRAPTASFLSSLSYLLAAGSTPADTSDQQRARPPSRNSSAHCSRGVFVFALRVSRTLIPVRRGPAGCSSPRHALFLDATEVLPVAPARQESPHARVRPPLGSVTAASLISTLQRAFAGLSAVSVAWPRPHRDEFCASETKVIANLDHSDGFRSALPPHIAFRRPFCGQLSHRLSSLSWAVHVAEPAVPASVLSSVLSSVLVSAASSASVVPSSAPASAPVSSSAAASSSAPLPTVSLSSALSYIVYPGIVCAFLRARFRVDIHPCVHLRARSTAATGSPSFNSGTGTDTGAHFLPSLFSPTPAGPHADAAHGRMDFGTALLLSGAAAYETVLGLQSCGAQAIAKQSITSISWNTSTWPTTRMCARTARHCTGSSGLEGERGFRESVMSDWSAQHSTLPAVAGFDMAMPGDLDLGSHTSWWGPNLTAFVDTSTIPDSHLDDLIWSRAFWCRGTSSGRTNQTSRLCPSTRSTTSHDPATNQDVDVQGDLWAVVRGPGAAGTALLMHGVLPPNKPKPKNIADFGSDAADASMGPNGLSDRGGDDGDGTDVDWWVVDLQHLHCRRADCGAWFRSGDAEILWSGQIVLANADSGEQQIAVDGNAGDRHNLTL